ncbi:hypothetical protein CY34DRAFT_233337 [Suillus luteus UH-Slu-Lm8-n1]|uniref:Uncharacterized protein n=1 Tax=Suillus luteus UH-Slu-Lm8-n1 TaxID=930992 RepID=A0A0D0BPA4_9AGAM|nr:hypothetical protein CY34DRAFT_233337 [Suillus luteus UH-Slu-Lm8-n1]
MVSHQHCSASTRDDSLLRGSERMFCARRGFPTTSTIKRYELSPEHGICMTCDPSMISSNIRCYALWALRDHEQSLAGMTTRISVTRRKFMQLNKSCNAVPRNST